MARARAGKGRLEELRDDAQRYGLWVGAYSPGDGVTRYRFFKSRKPVNYFGGHAIYTALGLKEARVFLEGYSKRGR